MSTITAKAADVPSSGRRGEAPAKRGAVRAWLLILAALVIAMAGVGGATRLTGSGLSITEWRPVTGVVPPLSDQAWQAEFGRYQNTPQHDLLNRGISLDEFKTLYWWESGHRLLGRVIGLAFFLPLAWFWARGHVRGRRALALLGLGAFGGLQGAVGWIMVTSGLQPGMVAVAPIKLTLHLTIAALILAGLVWVAVGLRPREPEPLPTTARTLSGLFVALVLVQIALGGLVAGSKAGLTYNTWPLMDGALIPPASVLWAGQPWIENLVDNPALVQLNHRLTAYLVVALALIQAWSLRRVRPGSGAARRATAVAGLSLAQMGLGVATLLLQVPLWAGLAHQLLAFTLLAMAVVHARRCAALGPVPAA